MKKTLYITFIALFGLVSCAKDPLNPVPSDSLTNQQMFTSVESAQYALNGGMTNIGYYLCNTLQVIMAEVMGEDALMTDGAHGIPTYSWHVYSYTYSQVAEDNWPFGYANQIWEYEYKAIDAANNVIAYVSEIPDQDGKEELLGQAYALRGFIFLRLARLFAANYTVNPDGPGIILRTEPANAASGHIGRASLKDTYTQILNDLDYGRQHCSAADTYYFTPKSCALFMARAYQDMGNYAKAKQYAEEAASNTFDGSNLMSQAEYASGFNEINDEWLQGFSFNETTSNLYASLPSYYYLAVAAYNVDANGKANPDDIDYLDTRYESQYFDTPLYGYSTVRWTKRFRDSFEDTDCRKLFPFYFYETDGWLTSKFSHRDNSLGVADFPMARIAEAYLIKAECEAQPDGNAATAKSVLNALQVARGATPTDGSLENIYKERRKELYGEGFRLADIKHQHKALDRSADPEHWATVKSLPADSPRFMLPIPQIETLYNKALTNADQNEYWRK
ncbi:MAG: RagB/SusD family nutrient uptake outer membrane protein [Bacteroidales bacterium]|nr:RagB/SusD family nutrient uptake outer membrane protein [Bacteroidales bacterium]